MNTKLSKDIYQNYDEDSILIWIDQKFHNEVNQYVKEIIRQFKFLKIKIFSNTEEAINYIKQKNLYQQK